MMRRYRQAGLIGVLAALVWAVSISSSTVLAQCAMCGSAAASSPGVARGLAYSIFFLLGMLALVVSWLVFLILRSRSRAETGVPHVPAPGGLSIPAAPLATGHAPADK